VTIPSLTADVETDGVRVEVGLDHVGADLHAQVGQTASGLLSSETMQRLLLGSVGDQVLLAGCGVRDG